MTSKRIDELITEYLDQECTCDGDCKEYFENMPSLKDAIINAALANNERGIRFSHQCWIKYEYLNKAKNKLLKLEQKLDKCKNFDEIWEVVNNIGVWGFGELCIYDTTQRIGFYLKKYPEKVYLHAGTREGANMLGLKGANKEYLEMSEIPKVFHRLEPAEIENFLCMKKKDFYNFTSSSSSGGSIPRNSL